KRRPADARSRGRRTRRRKLRPYLSAQILVPPLRFLGAGSSPGGSPRRDVRQALPARITLSGCMDGGRAPAPTRLRRDRQRGTSGLTSRHPAVAKLPISTLSVYT